LFLWSFLSSAYALSYRRFLLFYTANFNFGLILWFILRLTKDWWVLNLCLDRSHLSFNILMLISILIYLIRNWNLRRLIFSCLSEYFLQLLFYCLGVRLWSQRSWAIYCSASFWQFHSSYFRFVIIFDHCWNRGCILLISLLFNRSIHLKFTRLMHNSFLNHISRWKSFNRLFLMNYCLNWMFCRIRLNFNLFLLFFSLDHRMMPLFEAFLVLFPILLDFLTSLDCHSILRNMSLHWLCRFWCFVSI